MTISLAFHTYFSFFWVGFVGKKYYYCGCDATTAYNANASSPRVIPSDIHNKKTKVTTVRTASPSLRERDCSNSHNKKNHNQVTMVCNANSSLRERDYIADFELLYMNHQDHDDVNRLYHIQAALHQHSLFFAVASRNRFQ